MASPRHKDLVGKIFGRLSVLSLVGKHPTRSVMIWNCLCDCGKKTVKMTDQLTVGVSPSCGCWSKENIASANRRRMIVHGMSGTPTGITWIQMISRCYNPRNHAFKSYGGRGIMVCDFLRSSPLNLALIIGERPSTDLSLDRINNNMGYLCGTCSQCQSMGWVVNIRWATRKQQQRNRRNNARYNWNGEVLCGVELAEKLGIPKLTVSRKFEKFRVEKEESHG